MGLVGRSAEVGELAALLDRTAAGFGGVITLVGTAGSGKSSLAAEAVALARDRGFLGLMQHPLYDKWRVLVEVASVPSQLADSVEPVVELADERGTG